MTTEQEAKDALLAAGKVKADLDSKARAYFVYRYKYDKKWRKEWAEGGYHPPRIDSVYCGPDSVTIRCSAPACGRGCCGTNMASFTFPLSNLFGDWAAEEAGVLAREEEKAAKKAAKKAAREAREAAEEVERAAAWDRAEYARLREKFEGGEA